MYTQIVHLPNDIDWKSTISSLNPLAQDKGCKKMRPMPVQVCIRCTQIHPNLARNEIHVLWLLIPLDEQPWTCSTRAALWRCFYWEKQSNISAAKYLLVTIIMWYELSETVRVFPASFLGSPWLVVYRISSITSSGGSGSSSRRGTSECARTE